MGYMTLLYTHSVRVSVMYFHDLGRKIHISFHLKSVGLLWGDGRVEYDMTVANIAVILSHPPTYTHTCTCTHRIIYIVCRTLFR